MVGDSLGRLWFVVFIFFLFLNYAQWRYKAPPIIRDANDGSA